MIENEKVVISEIELENNFSMYFVDIVPKLSVKPIASSRNTLLLKRGTRSNEK